MKTILIVEDNEDVRENLAEILSLSNYKVLTAVNGKEGIEKAQEHLPDLIISDIMMPIMDGYGLLHVLRRNPKTEHLPVIFLTAKTELKDFRNAMQSGIDDFITKPFNADELLKTVESRLERAEILKRHSNTNLQDINGLLAMVSSDEKIIKILTEGHDSITYRKKQIIYKERGTPHYLYYILSGKVKTYKTHNDGKQLVMELYNEGHFLGYIALLEEGYYKETAEAMEETELVLIPRKDFENLLHKNISVANRMINILAKKITEQEQHLLGIAYDTLRKKVATAIISLQKKYQANGNGAFYIDILRDDLAAIAGTATESLIRTLSEFKNEKLIDVRKDSKIEIINSKKLENLIR